MNKLSIVAFVGILALTGCTPTPPTEINTDNTQATSTASDMVKVDEALLPPTTVYENKAVSYTIQRPANWFWRHLIRNEIGNTNPDVNDYFYTDPGKLGGLGSEFLGQFVIEVSRKPMSDFETDLKDLQKTTVTVAGIEADRYQGVRSPDGQEQQKVIVYLMSRDGQTYRFLYTNRPNNEINEALFEKMVASFSFQS